MTTAQDQQSREAYEDGKWYWVEREGWHGEPPTIAPAFYKANCDSWYSHVFSGISTPYLKVLEPCEMRNAGCARTLPAGVICYVRPGATLPRRMGWETCAATDAGALAVHADGRALDVGVEPVAWTVASGVTNWARDFSKYKTQHYVRPVFTASQVLAMGRVPACPYPCGWDGLHKIAVADGAYLAHIEWPEDEEGVSVQRAVAMRTVTNLIDVCRAMLAANQKAPTS